MKSVKAYVRFYFYETLFFNRLIRVFRVCIESVNDACEKNIIVLRYNVFETIKLSSVYTPSIVRLFSVNQAIHKFKMRYILQWHVLPAL